LAALVTVGEGYTMIIAWKSVRVHALVRRALDELGDTVESAAAVMRAAKVTGTPGVPTGCVVARFIAARLAAAMPLTKLRVEVTGGVNVWADGVAVYVPPRPVVSQFVARFDRIGFVEDRGAIGSVDPDFCCPSHGHGLTDDQVLGLLDLVDPSLVADWRERERAAALRVVAPTWSVGWATVPIGASTVLFAGSGAITFTAGDGSTVPDFTDGESLIDPRLFVDA
jgi:hypothetical protein